MKNIKLNKSERHTAYILMLAEAENENNYVGFMSSCCDGFCRLIAQLFDIRFNGDFKQNVKFFPELKKYSPKEKYGFGLWFDPYTYGWLERKEILKKCIEETY